MLEILPWLQVVLCADPDHICFWLHMCICQYPMGVSISQSKYGLGHMLFVGIGLLEP